MNQEELDNFKENYTSNELVDISDIEFNTELETEQMLNEYISKVKNPYHFKSGVVEIDILYAETNKTTSELLRDYFLRQK